MRLPDFNPLLMQRFTTLFQALQAVFIPIIMGVIAASMVQGNSAHSSTKFMFALTWLTIPALIYVAMTPRFERTKPLSNPYALCGFNAICCFMWFVALVALADYNNKAIGRGFDAIPPGPNRPASASCQTTSSGHPKECSLNKAAIALSAFMFLFFVVTTGIASYAALYYRVHLVTPLEAYLSRTEEAASAAGAAGGGGTWVEEHTKDAFDPRADSSTPGPGYALLDNGNNSAPHHHRRGGSLSAEVGPVELPYDGPSDHHIDEDYEGRLATQAGNGRNRRSVGSGSYESGQVGFPDGDYVYTQAGK